MTVLVALRDEDKIYVAADRQGTAGQIKSTLSTPKIFRRTIPLVNYRNESVGEKEIVIGLTGYSYLADYVEYNYKFPDMNEESLNDILEYLIPTFNKLGQELKDKNIIETNNDKMDSESCLLVVCDNKIFRVSTNFSVTREQGDYFTDGSGWEVALGSLYTSGKTDWTPERRVKEAVLACAEHTIYVNDVVDVAVVGGSESNGSD